MLYTVTNYVLDFNEAKKKYDSVKSIERDKSLVLYVERDDNHTQDVYVSKMDVPVGTLQVPMISHTFFEGIECNVPTEKRTYYFIHMLAGTSAELKEYKYHEGEYLRNLGAVSLGMAPFVVLLISFKGTKDATIDKLNKVLGAYDLIPLVSLNPLDLERVV